MFWKVYKRLLKLLAKNIPGYHLRCQLLRMAGYIIGEQVYIGEEIIIIDELDDKQRVRIGDRVSIAERVTLIISSNPNCSKIRPFVKNQHGRIEIGDLASLEADPSQMRQLFQNLISNGLKFHREEKPVIKVQGQTVNNPQMGGRFSGVTWVQIFVEDNGIGFDEKYLDRIFIPFQRLHGRGIYEGTGMGLTICRKITERHGGSVTAKSTPGKGSTFIVTLPMKQSKGGNVS